jgi:CheY-like chemotaxis protein
MNTDYKILVVDDDELVLEVVQKLLSTLPYTVVATSSPEKAIQILSMWEIAVLLCDLNMPQIDGVEVLTKARQINPDVVSILITGFADHEATIRAINEGGIWKFIPKPWKNEELVEVMKQAVERYDRLHRPQKELSTLAQGVTARMKSREEVRVRPKQVVVVKKKRAAEELPGGRYKLGEVIGEGGTGIVYKAEDLLLGMPVAIKIISPDLAGDREVIETLKEEARIAIQLSHRHIVRLHNLQISGGEYYLVMEYVKGETFRHILSVYGKLPLDSVLQLVEVACDALSYAHRHGIVHQDLKPENLRRRSEDNRFWHRRFHQCQA